MTKTDIIASKIRKLFEENEANGIEPPNILFVAATPENVDLMNRVGITFELIGGEMRGAAERKDNINVYNLRNGRRHIGFIRRCIRTEHGKLVVTYAGSVFEVKGDADTGYYIEIGGN